MLERSDLEPLFFAPFVSSIMRVDPAWIDHNGHLNMAYYNVLFDRAVDEAYELLGIGPGYVKQGRHSLYPAEVHVRFLRELHAGDPVRATFQLIAYDSKRLHYFEQLVHATEGYLAATSENLAIHVDMDSSKSAPMPAGVVGRLEKMTASHARLPRPQAAGRSVGMKRD
jgi:acyl-CoA thioester hydrolase